MQRQIDQLKCPTCGSMEYQVYFNFGDPQLVITCQACYVNWFGYYLNDGTVQLDDVYLTMPGYKGEAR